MWKTKDNQVKFEVGEVVELLMEKAREKWPELPDPDSKAVVSLELESTDKDYVVLDIEED